MSASTSGLGRFLRTRLPILLCVVWLVAMSVLYYVVHSPLEPLRAFDPAAFTAKLSAAYAAPGGLPMVSSALALNLVDTLAVALMVLISGALGVLILPGAGSLPQAECPIVQALAGLGVLALVVLALGMLGMFPPLWLAWLMMAAAVIALHRQVLAWIRAFGGSLRSLLWPSMTGLEGWLQWAIVALLALPLLIVLVPPYQWDSLTYHLAGPKLYLDAGRIVSFPENHFLGFPQTVEMLYLWLKIVARPNAAGLLHWCFSLMSILLTLSLARRAGRPFAGVLAAIGLLACDSLWGELTWPYNDMALVAFLCAALAAVLAWADAEGKDKGGLLILVGIFVGLSMSTKYTAFGAAIGVAAVLGWAARKDGWVVLARSVGVTTLTALLVFAPWMLKNAVLDGNPLSPFVWGTSAFDHYDQAYYLRSGTGLDAISVVLAPIQGTVFGRDQAAPYGSSTGLLAFTLLPLAALGWRRRPQPDRDLISRLAIFAIPPYLVWLAGIATSWYLVQTRLLYPIFPALLLIGGVGVDGLREQKLSPDPSLIVRVMAAAAAAIAVWGALFSTLLSSGWLVELGLESTSDYLTAKMGVTYDAFQQINMLPPGSKVQMLWEPRTFYCVRTCIPDSGIDLWWHDRQVQSDPHQIIAGWRARGITHVLISESGLKFLTTEDPYESLTKADVAALDQARQADLEPVWQVKGGYTLYHIVGSAP